MPFLAFFLTLIAAVQGGSPYRISGEVRDLAGKPLYGIQVTAILIDVQQKVAAGTTSDANGRFVLTLRGAGTYRLTYNEEPNGYPAQRTPFFQDPNNLPPQVTLTDQAPSAEVNILIKKSGGLTGQAIDAQTLLPIDNVTFRMCHAERRSPCGGISSKSADGTFSVPTPFVPFTLMVTAANYQLWVGMTGSEMDPISVPAETQTPLRLLMRRKPEAASLAINEAEKRSGINLPAPNQLSPIDNQQFEIFPRVTRLEWTAVEGAASYSIEIDVCQGRPKNRQCINPQPLTLPSNPASTNLMTTSYEFNFVGAQPGRWRVWAVDKEGREGFKSEWRTFVYLH
jgi:hypothetical protein